ncbi:MAG: S-methyl-5'-thioadenosine phosphorylase [Spirochaetales bacterium]|nr:S-methyl-5'-thioadenosine phosphorylase [Spirochaetales bacterium]
MQAKIAIIGGSGLYKMAGAKVVSEVDIPTPFGMPSDVISIVEINGTKVAFLPRHGKGHRLLPTEVPSRANIWALKSLGVEQIISVSAVGSLAEEYKPGDFVVCDQIIDRTRSRANSYFGEGIVGHVSFAAPFCDTIRAKSIEVLEKSGHPFHKSGKLITMEGPLFSTKGESRMYRSWGAHIIGMTALPECKLAREAEICFSVIAMVTDYDCWRESEEHVTIEMVIKVMNDNTAQIQKIVPGIVDALSGTGDCDCRHAAQYAVMTDKSMIPYETRRKLKLFYGKYWD